MCDCESADGHSGRGVQQAVQYPPSPDIALNHWWEGKPQMQRWGFLVFYKDFTPRGQGQDRDFCRDLAQFGQVVRAALLH